MGITKPISEVDDNDVKTAYFKKAKEYHPDINKRLDAVERFRLIQQSYEAVNSRSKRLAYMDTLQDSEWSNKTYMRRDNYTDVSSDFDRAFNRHAANSKKNKFMYRSLLVFEKIVHPSYLFGMYYI